MLQHVHAHLEGVPHVGLGLDVGVHLIPRLWAASTIAL